MKLNLIAVLILLAGCGAKADDGTENVKRLITKYALAYHIEREVLSCVLKIESNYTMGVVSETEDYGMSQINIKTAKMYNFNLIQLLSDVDYSIKAAAIVLSDYRTQFRSAEIVNWVGRYNIGYQSLTAGNAGTAYQTYNTKIWACRKSGVYL